MGLDMYMQGIKGKHTASVLYKDKQEGHNLESYEVQYWRKDYELNQIFTDMFYNELNTESYEKLVIDPDNFDGEFNCVDYIITKSQLECVLHIIKDFTTEDLIYNYIDVDPIQQLKELKDILISNIQNILDTFNFEEDTLIYSNWY